MALWKERRRGRVWVRFFEGLGLGLRLAVRRGPWSVCVGREEGGGGGGGGDGDGCKEDVRSDLN